MEKMPAQKIDLRGDQPPGSGLCGGQRAGAAGAPAPGGIPPDGPRPPERRKGQVCGPPGPQFREEQLLEPLFTAEEMDVFKRGRNASRTAVSKHATPRGIPCLHRL